MDNQSADFQKLARMQRMRRLVLAVIILATLACLTVVASSHENLTVRLMIQFAGLVLISGGILGRIWCTLYIGGRKAFELISKGPYSISRNPLYVFSAIAAGGIGALTGSVVVGLVFFAGCALAFHVVIAKEETYLADTLGADYQNYLARVPRFFPKLSQFEDDAELTVLTRRIYTTLNDGLVFFLAIPFFLIVDYLQTAGIIPVLLRLP